MKTYYALLDLQPKATPGQVLAKFRRLASRYRSTLSVEQIYADPRFLEYLNAYLTLSDESRRAQYDAALAAADRQPPTPPRPFDALTTDAQHLLVARVAFWRREMVEAIHQLRLALELDPDSATAWALLGEIYLAVGRAADAVHAYQRAMQAAPDETQYAERVQYARDVEAGKVERVVELTPEEMLLREERKQRWVFMLLIVLLGIASLGYSFLLPLNHAQFGFLEIPWRAVTLQAAGVLLLLSGLAYGRIISPFEHVMVWSGIDIGDRGRIRHMPYGVLLFSLAFASLWLAVLGFIIMAASDEEWPVSTSIMLGICAVVNVAFATLLFLGHLPWGYLMVFGGNVLVYAALLGWLVGSLDAPRYE